MSLWISIPLIALAGLCQATWLPLANVAGIKIDFALILVVAWGLLGKTGQAAAWGFMAGMILDLTSHLPFGSHTFALTGIGLLTQFTQSYALRDHFILPPAAMIGATFLYNLFLLFILTLLNPATSVADYLLRVTLPSAFLNTLALPIAYIPLQWVITWRAHS